MTFYFADKYEEVLEYLGQNIRLAPNSCMILDHGARDEHEEAFGTGMVHFALFESASMDEHGYVKIVEALDLEGEVEVGVIDLLFPGTGFCDGEGNAHNMYDYLEELAEFILDEGAFEKVYFNHDRMGVRHWFERCFTGEHLVRPVQLVLPPDLANRHFAEGTGPYDIVDLLDMQFPKPDGFERLGKCG